MAIGFPTPQVNSTVELVQYVNNELVRNSFGIGIMVLIWVILFTRMKINRLTGQAVASATFFTGLTSIFFFAIGIIPDIIMWGSLVLAIFGAIGLKTQEK